MPRGFPTINSVVFLRKLLSYIGNQVLHSEPLNLSTEQRVEVWKHLEAARKALSARP